MKKLIICLLLIILFVFSEATKKDPDHKITICHVPPGNPSNAHEITIDKSAWSAHQNNHEGDYIGKCKSNRDKFCKLCDKFCTVAPSNVPTNAPTGSYYYYDGPKDYGIDPETGERCRRWDAEGNCVSPRR